MTLSGDITADDLNDEFDAQTATINAQAVEGQKDCPVILRLESLASGEPEGVRSYAWTQQDDQQDRIFWFRVTDTGARAVSASLTVDGANEDNGNARFMTDNVVSIDLTTINGIVDSRDTYQDDFRDPEGTPFRLLKGIRYRLTVENESGGTVTGPLECGTQLRSVRRRR